MLLEDFGALIGLVLALLGVGLTLLTGNAVFDALGTIGIGVLLGVIAIMLIIEMKSLLIGEGAPPAGARRDRRRAGGRRGAARHPPAHAVPRARRSCWSRPRSRCTPGLPVEDVARAIDEAEARVRAGRPARRG